MKNSNSLSHFLKKFKRSKYYNKKATIVVSILVIVSIIGAVGIKVILSGEDFVKAPSKIEKWPELLISYKDDPNTNQLLFIKCEEESSIAEAFYFIKSEDSSNWDMAGRCQAYIGAKGLGKICEGDRKTPEGDFTVTGAFGIKPNPGTAFDYTSVNTYTVACDEDCQYYNQIIDIRKTGIHKGELMSEYTPQYYYGMTIDFNPENKYPLGSNIFLHCAGTTRSTAGCVAVEESMMLKILTTATPGFKICIHLK